MEKDLSEKNRQIGDLKGAGDLNKHESKKNTLSAELKELEKQNTEKTEKIKSLKKQIAERKTKEEAAAAAAAEVPEPVEAPTSAEVPEPVEAPTSAEVPAGAGVGVALVDVKGIGKSTASKLESAGINDVAELLAADPDELAEKSGLTKSKITSYIENAKELV
ncbi:MAG: helix-hairpin-helix domain-containing protein [Candidatus Hodarchaeota archaeon]